MELKGLLATDKKIEVEFPGMPGFKITLAYVGKDEIRRISEKSKTLEFDRSNRQPIEKIDDELFTKLYTKAAIKDWKGLKFEYLKDLVILDDGSKLPDEGVLEYTEENAYELVTNSKSFDSWISNVISDVAVFNKSS